MQENFIRSFSFFSLFFLFFFLVLFNAKTELKIVKTIRDGLSYCNIQIQQGLKAKLSIIFIVCPNKILNRVILSLLHVQQTFFVRFFDVALHDYNVKLPGFMEEMSYEFSLSFFFFMASCHSFSPYIGSRQHFSFSHRRYEIFMLLFQQKKCLLCFFISRSRSLSPFFSLSLAGLPSTSSFSLSFSCSMFQIVDMTMSSRQHGYRNNFRFLFSSLLTLQFSLLYQTRVAMRFPAKITSSCIWVAIPVD